MSETMENLARIEGPLTDAPAMITLRGDLAAPAMAAALKSATGCAMPAVRCLTVKDAVRALWMSPDELLLILPRAVLAAALAALHEGLAGTHHMAVDVSDARAVFDIAGPQADQVLRKLTPADLRAMSEDEVRRSRVAQVAAAFWREGSGYRLVCFRSVGQYMRDLLANAADGGALDPQ